MDSSTADEVPPSAEAARAAPGAGSSAGGQPAQLAQLPPLPPEQVGWIGAPSGGWQHCATGASFVQPGGWEQQCAAAGTYQAGGWEASVPGPSYAPAVEYLPQGQVEVP